MSRRSVFLTAARPQQPTQLGEIQLDDELIVERLMSSTSVENFLISLNYISQCQNVDKITQFLTKSVHFLTQCEESAAQLFCQLLSQVQSQYDYNIVPAAIALSFDRPWLTAEIIASTAAHLDSHELNCAVDFASALAESPEILEYSALFTALCGSKRMRIKLLQCHFPVLVVSALDERPQPQAVETLCEMLAAGPAHEYGALGADLGQCVSAVTKCLDMEEFGDALDLLYVMIGGENILPFIPRVYPLLFSVGEGLRHQAADFLAEAATDSDENLQWLVQHMLDQNFVEKCLRHEELREEQMACFVAMLAHDEDDGYQTVSDNFTALDEFFHGMKAWEDMKTELGIHDWDQVYQDVDFE